MVELIGKDSESELRSPRLFLIFPNLQFYLYLSENKVLSYLNKMLQPLNRISESVFKI